MSFCGFELCRFGLGRRLCLWSSWSRRSVDGMGEALGGHQSCPFRGARAQSTLYVKIETMILQNGVGLLLQVEVRGDRLGFHGGRWEVPWMARSLTALASVLEDPQVRRLVGAVVAVRGVVVRLSSSLHGGRGRDRGRPNARAARPCGIGCRSYGRGLRLVRKV